MLGDSPRYWRYTGETTPHHWKDGGLSLTNAGRWRSDTCLWFIKRNGWEHVPHSIYDELRGLVEALPNEELPAAEPTPSTEWVERAPLPRKRQPEKSWTPHPPEPQRAKPADTKPVPQAGHSSPTGSKARKPRSGKACTAGSVWSCSACTASNASLCHSAGCSADAT